MRELIGIDLGRENVPGRHDAAGVPAACSSSMTYGSDPAEVDAHLGERGLLMRQGTVVDATIIAAPSSTKNNNGKRDPRCTRPRRAGGRQLP